MGGTNNGGARGSEATAPKVRKEGEPGEWGYDEAGNHIDPDGNRVSEADFQRLVKDNAQAKVDAGDKSYQDTADLAGKATAQLDDRQNKSRADKDINKPDLTDDVYKAARMAEARRLRQGGRGRKSSFLSDYKRQNLTSELSSMPVNNDVALGG